MHSIRVRRVPVRSLVGILLFSSSSLAKKISLPLAFMLSSGGLLTTAFVHVIPEAIQGLEGEGNFRAMTTRGGITLFAGMSVGLILHVALGAGHSHPQGMSNASTTVRDIQTVSDQKQRGHHTLTIIPSCGVW